MASTTQSASPGSYCLNDDILYEICMLFVRDLEKAAHAQRYGNNPTPSETLLSSIRTLHSLSRVSRQCYLVVRPLLYANACLSKAEHIALLLSTILRTRDLAGLVHTVTIFEPRYWVQESSDDTQSSRSPLQLSPLPVPSTGQSAHGRARQNRTATTNSQSGAQILRIPTTNFSAGLPTDAKRLWAKVHGRKPILAARFDRECPGTRDITLLLLLLLKHLPNVQTLRYYSHYYASDPPSHWIFTSLVRAYGRRARRTELFPNLRDLEIAGLNCPNWASFLSSCADLPSLTSLSLLPPADMYQRGLTLPTSASSTLRALRITSPFKVDNMARLVGATQSLELLHYNIPADGQFHDYVDAIKLATDVHKTTLKELVLHPGSHLGYQERVYSDATQHSFAEYTSLRKLELIDLFFTHANDYNASQQIAAGTIPVPVSLRSLLPPTLQVLKMHGVADVPCNAWVWGELRQLAFSLPLSVSSTDDGNADTDGEDNTGGDDHPGLLSLTFHAHSHRYNRPAWGHGMILDDGFVDALRAVGEQFARMGVAFTYETYRDCKLGNLDGDVEFVSVCPCSIMSYQG
ncbi:hypothetical protein BDW74DRAFT_175520 [Aspergillus multicolor]|uniref:uncharacterized protein n=1 Tax=Aspergillus multicolor TaxID=41759 RepID=UPI003CCD2B6D